MAPCVPQIPNGAPCRCVLQTVCPSLYSPEPHPGSLLCTPKLPPGNPCVLQNLVCPAGCTPVRRTLLPTRGQSLCSHSAGAPGALSKGPALSQAFWAVC